jgi:hypothetical protein
MISSSDKFIFRGANGDEAGTVPGIYGPTQQLLTLLSPSEGKNNINDIIITKMN